MTRKGPFKKILVANRGEIALRIIRAIHAYGATAISVYSDPDANALHVLHSDEAYRLGAGPARDSYLNIEAVIAAAAASGAQAIHPGYGFLSENADFAQAVTDAGMAFIGPPADVIRLMGDKVAAKRIMAGTGVPLIPGYDGDDQSHDTLRREAERMGFPIMLKAASGGGGRGMRIVDRSESLDDAIAGAKREATTAFGDDRLFMEKLLTESRHVEVQVLGDAHGNLIHLFERDCSIQRRHQKVIEEAPSGAITDEQRAAICAAGIQAAKAARYVNAGTIEFLWHDGAFYFLEMNTRIQVEHGVTELVTGRDLVRAQIDIAAGSPLAWSQEDIRLTGHAIEARVYAEDSSNDFLPQAGRLTKVRFGSSATSLRIDAAVETGSEVSRFYDPMIAKVMVHNSSRSGACADLSRILDGTLISGVKTNLSFLRWAIASLEFAEARADTSFAESWITGGVDDSAEDDDWLLGMFAIDAHTSFESGVSGAEPHGASVWSTQAGWRLGGQSVRLCYRIGNNVRLVEGWRRPDHWSVVIDGTRHFDIVIHGDHEGQVTVLLAHVVARYRWQPIDAGLEGELTRVALKPTTRWIVRASLSSIYPDIAPTTTSGSKSGMIEAPMPGTVIKVHSSVGDMVHIHQPVMVLEAMKMEHVLEAPGAGTVTAIHHDVGDLVTAGEPLIEISPG